MKSKKLYLFMFILGLVFNGCTSSTSGYRTADHNGKLYYFPDNCPIVAYDNHNIDKLYCYSDNGERTNSVLYPLDRQQMQNYRLQRQRKLAAYNYYLHSKQPNRTKLYNLPSNTYEDSLNSTNSSSNYLGNYTANRHRSNSTQNKYGLGSQYNTNSINNSYGQYGSKYSNKSISNPYATNAPKLYNSKGEYRGRLSSNKYDPDSVSNPYGKYGSKYSAESINNPYGAGSKYKNDSPSNPYGQGMSVYGQ